MPVASPSGGSDDDDDRLLFKENKKVFLDCAAVLFEKKEICMAVLKRSVGSKWLIEQLARNG